ncbi:MAG: hypothetical protein PVI09_13125 [Anaerolineae bacterium]|jgi:hypothetical protein
MSKQSEQDNTPAVYEIRVRGELDRSWQEWFEDMVIAGTRSEGDPITSLIGPVADQSALRGIMTRLWDLNLVLESVVRVKDADIQGG